MLVFPPGPHFTNMLAFEHESNTAGCQLNVPSIVLSSLSRTIDFGRNENVTQKHKYNSQKHRGS
jgi:hypothetical protein